MAVDDPAFRIRPAWPDTMVYEEFAPGDDGAPRELRFNCRAADEPPQVVVPSRALWLQGMPAWARARRDVVIARLRTAGCVPWVHEPDGGWVESPDGRLVVRVSAEHDERCGPWERITVWCRTASGQRELAAFTSFGLGATLRFMPGDTAVFDPLFDRDGQRQRIVVDAEAGTFGFHPNERPQPLRELDAWLGNRAWGPMGSSTEPSSGLPGRSSSVAVPAQPPWRRAARALLGTILLLAGLLLSAGGAWMALAADSPRDRLAGLFGCLFFAGCAWLELRELASGRATCTEDAPITR
jgi:hypothetical protein